MQKASMSTLLHRLKNGKTVFWNSVMTFERWHKNILKRMGVLLTVRQRAWFPNTTIASAFCGVAVDRARAIVPRRSICLLAVLLISASTVVCARIRTSESGDPHSALCSHCPAIAQALLLTQKVGPSSDALVESLERALSEGKAQKAHDLSVEILKRPHPTSDVLLR